MTLYRGFPLIFRISSRLKQRSTSFFAKVPSIYLLIRLFHNVHILRFTLQESALRLTRMTLKRFQLFQEPGRADHLAQVSSPLGSL